MRKRLERLIEISDSLGWSLREAAKYPDVPQHLTLHLRRAERLTQLVLRRIERMQVCR